MNERPQPCMGGWCGRRDHCPHHQSPDRREPAERLCPPGLDGAVLALAEIRPMPWLPSEREHRA